MRLVTLFDMLRNPSFKMTTRMLSWKIINIYNDIAPKYGNVAVKHFRKYEKLEYKKNKLKLEIDFLNNCKQQNFLSSNCRMFLIKTHFHFVKDSFVAPSISIIRNSNNFQKNLVSLKTFYVHSFLLLTSTSLQNL